MPDGLDDQTVGQTLDYLGQKQPGFSPRLTTLPSASAAGGGSVGPPLGGTTGGRLGETGTPMGQQPRGGSALATALGGGKTALDLARRLFSSEKTPTRGDTGGVSLSDRLRSAGAELATAVGPSGPIGAAGVPFSAAIGFQGGALTPLQEAGQALIRSGVSAESLLQMSPEAITSAAAQLGTGATGAGAGAGAQLLEQGGAQGLGAALSQVAPFAGAAVSIIQDALSGKKPVTQQAIDAALDTAAAAAVASGVGAWVAPALLAAKQETANVLRLAGGKEPSTARKAFDILEMFPTGIGITGLAIDTLLGLFGKDVTTLFGGKGSYIPKRQAAGQEATADLASLGGTLQAGGEQFAKTGDLGGALTALQTQFGPRNPVRADVNVPTNVAKQLGIGENIVGTARDWGDHLQLTWADIKTPQQFQALLGYMASQPDQGASMLLGSGDVGYLPGGQASQVAASATAETLQYLQFLMSRMGGAGPGGATAPPPLSPQGPEAALGFQGPKSALGFAQEVTGA